MKRTLPLLLLSLTMLAVDGGLVAGSPRRQEDKRAAAEAEVKRLGQSVVQSYQRGEYKEALTLAQRAAEVAEAGLGPEDPLTTGALSNLGALYLRANKLKEAEPHYERILATREKSRGPSAPHVAAALENYLCVLARMEAGKTTPEFLKKFNRLGDVFVADSAAAAGHQMPFAEGELTRSKALVRPPPQYPLAAKSAGVIGSVVVRLRIDEQGAVTGVKALDCSPPALRQAAEDAALGIRFEPQTVRGKAIPVNTFIVYRFLIQ